MGSGDPFDNAHIISLGIGLLNALKIIVLTVGVDALLLAVLYFMIMFIVWKNPQEEFFRIIDEYQAAEFIVQTIFRMAGWPYFFLLLLFFGSILDAARTVDLSSGTLAWITWAGIGRAACAVVIFLWCLDKFPRLQPMAIINASRRAKRGEAE